MIDAATGATTICLYPAEYETLVLKSNVTLIGEEGVTVDCINLNFGK